MSLFRCCTGAKKKKTLLPPLTLEKPEEKKLPDFQPPKKPTNLTLEIDLEKNIPPV